MARKLNPLVLLGALGAGAFALLASKKSSAATLPPGTPGTTTLPGGTVVPAPTLPATPAPAASTGQTVSVNGHTWKLVPVSGGTDVFAPAGSWGPHGELRVLRFTGTSPRVLAGVAADVPKAVLDAAMKDLGVVVPNTAPATPSPSHPTSVINTPGRPPMPTSLQQEMIAAMMALGVGSDGVVRGPTTAEAVRNATELSSRLEQSGYPEAAAAMRSYAQAASKLLPPPPAVAPAIPGVPAAVMATIQRALELERDPAKLEGLKNGLKNLPASPERDMLIGALDALILQIRTAQAISQAATAIDQQIQQTSPGLPTGTTTAPPAASSTGTRILKLTSKPYMTGADVRSWQQVLIAAGYEITADGIFGPATDAATIDWQKKRGLTGDGDVGPATRAKIGTPPTAPMSVPATASPRPDPKPKTAIEVNAESVATHLRALQSKYGVSGSKGKQDLTLVKRFQSAVGGVADGLPGVNTILALARNGVGQLPAVMYWPKTGTKAKDLPAFRTQVVNIAKTARAAGNATLAAALEASAARETGAAGLK